MSKKLELNRETLRDLSDMSLEEVTGGDGAVTGLCGGHTGTFVCPSGATWFASCESTFLQCG